jgi:hypothetical protein
MILPPAGEQVFRILFHNPKRSDDIRGAHSRGVPDGLRLTDSAELNHHLAVVAPNVDVWGLVLARWEVDHDSKAVDSKDRWH